MADSEPGAPGEAKPRRLGTFTALRHRNYRLWFFGQTVSMMGTWMQQVAQGWLVYQLTGSELALGTVSFIGSIPTLFLILPAGAIVDRIPRRRLLMVTQSIQMLLAFGLAILVATGILQVWHIAVMAALLGITMAFDAPARQALAVEMVDDRRDLMNAIALNSGIFNLARIAGPAIGGVVLAAVGAAWCFGLNGASFLAVIVALGAMRFAAAAARPVRSGPLLGQIKIGLRYVWDNRQMRAMMSLLAVSGLFGFSYAVLMPVFAADVLKVGKAGLGVLNAAVGAGALIGSLTIASLGQYRRKALLMTAGSVLFPTALIGFAFSPYFPLSLALLGIAGFAFVMQNATINTLTQVMVPDELRGRVMAVFTLMMFGTSPFGSLQAGVLAEALGPRLGVAIGAAVSLAYALILIAAMPSLRRHEG